MIGDERTDASDLLRGLCEERSAEIKRLRQEIAEFQASADLRWDADMRAIKRWQEATGATDTWPDHADLCVWLLEQLDTHKKEQARELDARLNKLRFKAHDEKCELYAKIIGDAQHRLEHWEHEPTQKADIVPGWWKCPADPSGTPQCRACGMWDPLKETS